LHFNCKWPPPAVQPHHSHEDGHCFPSYRCIPGIQSSQATSVSKLGEVEPHETVFWRLAEHSCMHLFSHTQSRKGSSPWETPFWKNRILAVKIGNKEIDRQFWNLW
jgi:hypothetical protein